METAETVFKFKNNPKDFSQLPKYLTKAFDEVLMFLVKTALPHHKIGLTISFNNFYGCRPIGIHYTAVSGLKSSAITDLLGSVAQSNSNFLITDLLTVTSTILKIPYGKGRLNISRANFKDNLKLKI